MTASAGEAARAVLLSCERFVTQFRDLVRRFPAAASTRPSTTTAPVV